MDASIVLFLNDWPVRPSGANSGGGEVATVALANAFRACGRNVHVFGNLPEGECQVGGVNYHNFGCEYGLKSATAKLRSIGPYHCFAATLVHPFLFMMDDPNCLSRIVINHSPSIVSSGLEPATVMQLADYMVCVSEAQRTILLSRGGVSPDRIRVVKNGFSPELFTYHGPEGRRWRRLIYTGRLEPAKGIHNLIEAFTALKQEFPDLELFVFGDESYWPDLAARRADLESTWSGLKFFGKVPQSRLAEELRSAGLLVFPSVSFESAGLAVIDAQASGCPVVGTKVGGVPEYLAHERCGLLVPSLSVQSLFTTLQSLLRAPERLAEMSRNCLEYGRSHSWVDAASQLLDIATAAARSRTKEIAEIPAGPLQRTARAKGETYERLLEDHDIIANGTVVGDGDIDRLLSLFPEMSAAYLWKGLRSEFRGEKDAAKTYYLKSQRLSGAEDWQALFRLVLMSAEASALPDAAEFAQQIIQNHPAFPMRAALEQLVQMDRDQPKKGIS